MSMSSKESNSGAALPSAARAKDGEEPDAKKNCTEHPLMRGVRSIPDEFAGVPKDPIWLAIACFMQEEERNRVFPNIPELKGMERLAEAQVASLNARKSISRVKNGDSLSRDCYFVKPGSMALLFPAGMESFLNDVNGPDTKPKKPTDRSELPREEDDSFPPEAAEASRKIREQIYKNQCQTYKNQCQIYKLQCEIYEIKLQLWPIKYLDRIENALLGKEHLYSKEDPRNMLAVAQDKSEMWFEWGADKCGFDSTEKFDEFCAMAGVDPTQAFHRIEFNYSHRAPNVEAVSRGIVWVSHDRKVTFTASSDPRRGGYCHYFGCTGIRPRSKFLFEWFKENGSGTEYCWNGRSFI